MKKQLLSIFLVAALFAACSKSGDVSITTTLPAVGNYIKDGDTLNSPSAGSIKGTLKKNVTYYLYSGAGDAVINAGDTLMIESGVKVLIVGPSTGNDAIGTQGHAPGIVVKGTFICLGTKDAPVLFTVKDNALKSDPAKDPQSPQTDPAFKGYWGGIQGTVGCGDIIIKWTRIEYTGGLGPANDPYRPNASRYGIYMQNPAANFVLEDSWLYGSVNDMVRVTGGKFEIMRNTFEKVGLIAGECVNVKSGSVGDIAYNLVVGGTGNAFKSANAGGLSPQSNANIYNNTVVSAGYRQQKVGEGGSIDFENGGRGASYNNMLMNCAFGLAVMGGGNSTPAADTANLKYGYTYNYGDTKDITAQFLPAGYITKQQSTDINGGNATAPGANNPLFVNYQLPVTEGFNFITDDYVGNRNFHLQTSSPAVGKGFTGFQPYSVVKKDPVYGATEITPPGKDMGAFQMDKTGNQH
jgi:hypothetical protein